MTYLSRLINIAPYQGESLKNDFDFQEHLSQISNSMFQQSPPLIHIIYISKGSISLSINHQENSLKASHIIFLLPHQIIKLNSFSQDLIYRKLSLSLAIYNEITKNVPNEILVEINRNPILHFSTIDSSLIRQYARIVKEKCLNPHHFTKDSIIKVLFAFIIDIYHILVQKNADIRLIKPNYQKLFESFRDLVTLHYQERLSVTNYAAKLNITSDQLGDCVKKSTGINTKQWLNNHLIQQIKTQLINNIDNLESISIEYNFPSTNSFNQFYRYQTQESPTAYRSRMLNQKQNG